MKDDIVCLVTPDAVIQGRNSPSLRVRLFFLIQGISQNYHLHLGASALILLPPSFASRPRRESQSSVKSGDLQRLPWRGYELWHASTHTPASVEMRMSVAGTVRIYFRLPPPLLLQEPYVSLGQRSMMGESNRPILLLSLSAVPFEEVIASVVMKRDRPPTIPPVFAYQSI